MRIACLQFAPQLGDVNNNLNRADAVLNKAGPSDLDLLILPELAFSGYNFKSLQHITPYLEPTAAGITSLWARTTALKYNCIVHVGYPEKVDISKKWPCSPEFYNSTVTVNRNGETVAHYRKTFLYYTDETWALEGPDGFYDGELPELGHVAMGICMDLNPYKFEAPWSAWEFAHHILHRRANLVIMSMAWLTREDVRSFSQMPKEPDMETLSYWLSRLEPLIRAEDVGEIIVVLANRCGNEDEAVYAGTSAVIGIDAGEVKLYGVLGRGVRELLVVDTSHEPEAKLVSDPQKTASRPVSNGYEYAEQSTDSAPSTPDRDNFISSIDEILSSVAPPISPLEAAHPHHYFSTETPRVEDHVGPLQSSSRHNEIRKGRDRGDSPAYTPFDRPVSPKSRSSSRQANPVIQEPIMIQEPIITQEPIIISHQLVDEPVGEKYDEPEISVAPHVITNGNTVSHSMEVPSSGPTRGKSGGLAPVQDINSMVPRPRSTVW